MFTGACSKRATCLYRPVVDVLLQSVHVYGIVHLSSCWFTGGLFRYRYGGGPSLRLVGGIGQSGDFSLFLRLLAHVIITTGVACVGDLSSVILIAYRLERNRRVLRRVRYDHLHLCNANREVRL